MRKTTIALRLPVDLLDELASLDNRSAFIRDALAAGLAAGLQDIVSPWRRHSCTELSTINVSVPADVAHRLSQFTKRQSISRFAERSLRVAMGKPMEPECKVPVARTDVLTQRLILRLPAPLVERLAWLEDRSSWMRDVLERALEQPAPIAPTFLKKVDTRVTTLAITAELRERLRPYGEQRTLAAFIVRAMEGALAQRAAM